jgi:phosphopantothenoylcysteine decarboxylase/phosphopantothenate--cysteine ligase
VETAEEMQQAVEQALPADIAIFVAAVADWRPANNANEKIKKGKGQIPPALKLVENPDILKGVGTRTKGRPKLVIGFAAETSDIIKHGKAKLVKKGADWILANDVSAETGVMGGDNNTIRLLSKSGVDDWPKMGKHQVARQLTEKIIAFFENETIEI